MTPIENPECYAGCEVQMERVGREWVCSCCGRAFKVGEKPEKPRPKTDLSGVLMDDDG